MTIAEIADEQVSAEGAEAGRSDGDAPRRVQLPARRHALEEMAARVENVHEPQTLAGHRAAVPCGVLLRVGDVQLAAEVLNVEWRKSGGDIAVAEVAEAIRPKI